MNYRRIYSNLVNRGKSSRRLNYTEKHHIIPKCKGGTDDQENLTYLTAREHYLCHLLLTRIYPDDEKLKYAFWCMVSMNNRKYKVSSRLFEEFRIKLAEMKKGSKHSVDTINKMSKPRSEKGKANMRKPKSATSNMRKPKPEGFGDKISKALTGRKLDKKHAEKISEALKGRTKPKVKCPVCGTIGGSKGAMKRWHFNNCKKSRKNAD